MAPNTKMQLPVSVVGKIDINRLIREIEALDEMLRQAGLRSPGSTVRLPRTTRLLDDLAQLNGLNLLDEHSRQQLTAFLKDVKTHAPTVQISFATDPSAAFTRRIVMWFRQETHPYLLLQLGLQPNIAAGCTVRTPSKYFDFSLRRNFASNKSLLAKMIEGQV